MTYFGNRVETKEIQFFVVFRNFRPFGKKFLYHQFSNVMIKTHAKFALLHSINKTMIEERRLFTQTENPLLQIRDVLIGLRDRDDFMNASIL